MNKETIFEFFDTKYPYDFVVEGYNQKEGISAMVIDLKYNDQFVARIIRYGELDKPYTVCSKELLSQTNDWFGLSSYKCETLFDEWLKEKKLV